MNGYTYPQQQQQQPQQQTQHQPQQQNAPIPGGINPSMLQGGGGSSGSLGQMHGMNPMLARQQQQQQGLMGGMGMGAGGGGMNAMNGMGGMPGMASGMGGGMNGMNGMGGNMGNMAGMGGMNGMGGMGGGAMNIPGRMNNMDLMNNMKTGGGGSGMGSMNGMGFDNSMGMNPAMMNSGMGNVSGGMGMSGGVGSMSQQDIQKFIAQRQMNMGGMNNVGGMSGIGMGGMGGMNMANQSAMNGMNPNMNAMGMSGMMGNNPNLLAMQQMQLQMQQQSHMHQQSQAQQQPHTPNQVHSQSPHSASTPASSNNQYPPFPQNLQTSSMPPPPPRPSTAMSSSSHTSASQHPGSTPGMSLNIGSGIVRPPTAAGHQSISAPHLNAQYPGGPQSIGQQISRPGTASGHPPQSAGGEPPRTPLIGQMPHSAHPRDISVSRPPSRPQTAQSNAGGAPQTPVQAHSPGAMRSMSSGPTSQMNGMPMAGGANAMNVMGGMNMNGRVPPGTGGMPSGAMGGQSPGMMMPPGMARQPSMGGGQQSPIHSSHSQGPHTPHQQQPGMMGGRSTPTPLSAGGRMRAMSGAADGHDTGLGMGMGAMGGMPGADGSTQPGAQMPNVGMMNNMMPNMGMGNMGAMNGMNGLNPAQLQQFQEMQQRKAVAQAEYAKQQQVARMQQAQMQGAQGGMASGAMPGAMDGQAMGMGLGQPHSPAGAAPGMGGAAPQLPLGTPTRPPAVAAQMPGVQPGPSSISGMGTPGRPAGPAGLGMPLPPSAGAPQVNGAQVTATAVAANQTGPIAELPPLPANVQLNPKTTRVTAVPISEAGEKIPQLTEEEIKQVAKWREADKAYEARMQTMALRAKQELAQGPAGVKPRWWERDLTPTANIAALAKRKDRFDLHYPPNAQQLAVGRKRGKRREGLRLPGRLKPADAERGEQLVPIRLEFDVEHHKYRDTFVWNLNDPIVTPEIFAQSVVDDYGLPPSYHSTISKLIEEQLSDHKMHTATLGDNADESGTAELASGTKGPLSRGQLDSEDEAWWTLWRAGLRNEDGQVRVKKLLRQGLDRSIRARGKKRRREVSDAASEALSMIASSTQDLELPDYDENIHEEMRITIKLDITVGEMKLDDQFEWDTENVDPTPEQFAEIYSSDLGLAGEFKTAIAHSIREQVSVYQKSLFLVGHPSDGTAIQDDDLRMSFLPTVGPVARSPDATQLHQPIISYLSEGELDRIDKEREKEANRRRKRNTRGRRGVALPDREPQKTHRTPAIGFPEIDPQVLALAAAAAAPTSRRAAAAAASLTIANMVASENGTAFLPSNVANQPSAPSVPTSKVPKAKGSFKAPTYSADIIKPRASLSTATTSTAATLETYEQLLEGDAPLPASVIPAAPEPRPSRALTAKRQRELEKEAKEREYADGQHGNYIDGVWHCSNCGIPEDIAIGRRKGPLGDKSQCGACGKFWHRHRRPRPVEYHADKQWHLNAIAEADRAKSAARKKGGAAALRALTMSQSMSLDSAATPASDDPTSPPPTKQEMWVEIPTKKQRTSHDQDDISALDRPLSPASSISSTSASERPLAQMVGMNGAASKPSSAAVTPLHGTSELPQPDALARDESDPPAAVTASVTPAPENSHQRPFTPPTRPDWLVGALESMRAGNPEDLFDVVPRKQQNSDAIFWKIKCNDCPGKLYNVGPEQTLSNFEVHLKNRQHRNRVVARRNGVVLDPIPAPHPAQMEENGTAASPAIPTPAA